MTIGIHCRVSNDNIRQHVNEIDVMAHESAGPFSWSVVRAIASSLVGANTMPPLAPPPVEPSRAPSGAWYRGDEDTPSPSPKPAIPPPSPDWATRPSTGAARFQADAERTPGTEQRWPDADKLAAVDARVRLPELLDRLRARGFQPRLAFPWRALATQDDLLAQKRSLAAAPALSRRARPALRT